MRSFLVARPSLLLFVLTALSQLPLHAAVQSRITTAVSDASRTRIANTIPRRAKLATDLGEAPGSRKLESVTLHFNMTAAQQADLNQLLQDQQNPNSASYHQWLTPAQFGARFGLSSADLYKVTTWLTSKGLTVVSVAPSSTDVTVSGTVSQVEQAFGVNIHAMSENGEQHIANINDPQLPTVIANIVTGISGLHDFKLKPRARVSSITPRFTSSQTGNHYMAPGDFYTIYDVNQLISNNSINGTGISIAVIGQTDISSADVAAFRSASGLPANAPTIVQATGYVAGTVSGDIDEAQLDVEWSGAVAPNASILFVTVGASKTASVIDALNYAINNNLAPIITISYGNCESGWGQSMLNSINQKLQQANAQGITVIGPSGDAGATDCDTAPPADFGLTVDFPASSPYVTAAGGTMFNEGNTTGTTTYWNSNSSSSTANAGSAISYIPETVWNESNSTSLGAAGGGVSAYFAKPAWQKGTGVPSDSARDVPDVSFNAASAHDGYLFCSQGSCTNGFRNASGNLNVVGGTSVASPTLAGVFALLEQYLGGGTANRIGNANPMIYGLANSTYYNNVFHDITSGNNNSLCQQGTTNCPNGGNIGYSATTGYDLATGWGSLDVYNFVTKWKLATPTGGGGSTIGTALSSTSVITTAQLCSNASGSIPLAITVSNASASTLAATPSGAVQILVDNTPVSGTNTAALTNGSAAFTLNTSTLSSGQHTISVIYPGDTTFASSKGTVSVDIVSSSQKDFALTPCTASATTRSGTAASGVTFTLTPANGFTGTVTLSASVDSSVSASYAFSPATITISSSSPVTTSLVLTAAQSNGSGTPLTAHNTRPVFGNSPWYLAGSGATLACLIFFAVPRRRRWGVLVALVISVVAISASGCGSSSSSSSSGNNNTAATNAAPGTYTVNVTATSGALVHTSTMTFIVQ